MAVQIVRLAAVIGLLAVAAAIATPRGRVPLALRGLAKMLAHDRGQSTVVECSRRQSVSGGRRALAFTLVLIAILLALI